MERWFELLRQKEANERMHRENSDDRRRWSLAAELKQYAAAADGSALPAEALRKANELEKLARKVRHRLNDSMLRAGAR